MKSRIALMIAVILVAAPLANAGAIYIGQTDVGTDGDDSNTWGDYGYLGTYDLGTLAQTDVGYIGSGENPDWPYEYSYAAGLALGDDGTIYGSCGSRWGTSLYTLTASGPVTTYITHSVGAGEGDANTFTWGNALTYDSDDDHIWMGSNARNYNAWVIGDDPVRLPSMVKVDAATGDFIDSFIDLPADPYRLDGMAYGNETLYGCDEGGPIYSIDQTTGAQTLIGTVPGAGWKVGSLAYVDGRLIIGGYVEVWSMDPSDGTYFVVGTPGDWATGTNRIDGMCPIPEPMTLAVLALGGIAALLRRRR